MIMPNKPRKLRLKVDGVGLVAVEMEKDIYFFITKSIKIDNDLFKYGLVIDMSNGAKIVKRYENFPGGDKKSLIEKNDRVEKRVIEKHVSIKALFDSKFAIRKYNL